jgi:thiol:disulfide interchange protein
MVLCALLALMFSEAGVCAGAPEVFSTKTAAEARREAKDAGKMFILDATAVWCGPCKQMDKTTWIDEKVVSWIRENAIAAQLDVDKNKTLSQALKIGAMPTVVVFKNDEEFDRIVGYRNAVDLLTWLNGANEGKRDIDRLKAAAGDRAKGDGKVDIQARYQLA